MRTTLWLCASLATAGVAHAAPGEFDRGFGQQGIYALQEPGFARALFVATDPAGNVVSGGAVSGTDAVARTASDGAPDTHFNGRGYRIGPEQFLSTRTTIATLPLEGGRTLVLRNDRAICFGPGAGACATFPGNFFLERLEPNGQVDLSYGTQGSTQLTDPAFHSGLAVEPGGGVILVGLRRIPTRLSVKRVAPNGLQDLAFSANASAAAPCVAQDPNALRSAALMRQPDGRLLIAQSHAAGSLANPSSYPQCVRRLNADGTLDASYGVAGQRDLDALVFTSQRNDPVAVLPTAGNGAAIVFQLDYAPPSSVRFLHAIAWLREDGSFDTSRFDRGITGPSDMHVGRVFAAAIQPDGKILLAGYPNAPQAAEGYDRSQPRVGRLRPEGGNDLTFGLDRQGFTPLLSFGKRVEPNDLHVGADNVIYVAGARGEAGPVNQNEMLQYAIAKLEGDSPSSSGGGGGCGAIATPMPPDPTLPALVLAAVALLLARRRHARR